MLVGVAATFAEGNSGTVVVTFSRHLQIKIRGRNTRATQSEKITLLFVRRPLSHHHEEGRRGG